MNFYLQSFLIFLKIGLFTIGGGYAMVPLIQDEIVDKRKWTGCRWQAVAPGLLM